MADARIREWQARELAAGNSGAPDSGASKRPPSGKAAPKPGNKGDGDLDFDDREEEVVDPDGKEK